MFEELYLNKRVVVCNDYTTIRGICTGAEELSTGRDVLVYVRTSDGNMYTCPMRNIRYICLDKSTAVN